MKKSNGNSAYNGKGCLYYDDERERFFYRFYYTTRFGERKRKCVSGESETDCINKAEEFMRRVTLPEEKAKITISDILTDEYQKKLIMNKITEATMVRKLYTIEIIENGGLGNIPIIDITEEHINNFLYWLKRYSNSDIDKTFGAIKLAFELAVKKGVLENNSFFTFDIVKPRSDKSDKKVYAFERNERSIFLKALEEYKVPRGRNDYRLQLKLAFYTGMRMGEINALKPDDIDFNNNIIHIRRTITKDLHGNAIVGDTTKTYSGVRDLPVKEQVLDILREAIDKMGENPYGLIFYDYNAGRPIRTQNVNSAFSRICESANLPCYGQHMLRHTFATYCIEAQVPILVVSRWLGHTDIKTTMNKYADALARFQSESLDKLEEFLNDTL